MKKAIFVSGLVIAGLYPFSVLAKDVIVIVPGIMGSTLNKVTSSSEEIWPNIGLLGLPGPDNYLNELKLDVSGNESLIPTHYSKEVISNVLGFPQYGNLINQFKNNGYQLDKDLFILPYDWRLNIASTSFSDSTILSNDPAYSIGPKLDKIAFDARENGQKVTIIAHSMGGLLVKNYLIRRSFNLDFLDKAIFVGMPQLGAPKAFKLLNYGDDMGFNFFGLGLNPLKAKEISQNMPSVYQLLPSKDYFDNVGSYVRDERGLFGLVGGFNMDYNAVTDFMTSDPGLPDHRNNFLLNTAQNFHDFLDLSQSLSAGTFASKMYNIIGCNTPTLKHIVLKDNNKFNVEFGSGDGTVPTESADYNTQSQNDIYVNNNALAIDHLGLVKDPSTLGVIYNLSQNASASLPYGMGDSKGECSVASGINASNWWVFSTHSPVNLNIYDDQNHHVGLNANGDPELGIPGSDFFQIGDNSFALVPAGPHYHLGINAYNTGSFDFNVEQYSNDAVIASLSFDDVSIPAANLTANFSYDDIASHSDLFVDQNGDGTNDYYLDQNGNQTIITPPAPAITIDSTIADVEASYIKGWITKKQAKDSLIQKLNNATKIVIKMDKVKETLPDGKKKTKIVQRLEKRLDHVLGVALLKDLDQELKKGTINLAGYNLIKEDINSLLSNN